MIKLVFFLILSMNYLIKLLTFFVITDTIKNRLSYIMLLEKGIFFMMYMHYCKPCHRVHMLNGHKMTCPKCGGAIIELRIPYMDYVSMDMAQRNAFKEQCADKEQLKELSTTYRMYKYSKWYKELNSQRC